MTYYAGYTDRDTTTGTGHHHTGTGHHHTGTGTGLSASGVRGLDVQPGEVIDRKYYTGTENRPQEQALGKYFYLINAATIQYQLAIVISHAGSISPDEKAGYRSLLGVRPPRAKTCVKKQKLKTSVDWKLTLLRLLLWRAVEQYREHNPYAKQYETTVQHTGRERLVGTSIEALGTNVSHSLHSAPCYSSKSLQARQLGLLAAMYQ